MSEPKFVSLQQVLRAHEISLERHGGSPGVRDAGLLESAVQQPLNDYFYGEADLAGIAAAYAFHIAQAQAFLDGNKRTAISTALIFLELNGTLTRAAEGRLYDGMIAIAERRLDKAELAEIFRELFA